eukprot:5715151-Prymnesium_polylepis.1
MAAQRAQADAMEELRLENDALRARMSDQLAEIQRVQLEEKQARQWQEQQQQEREERRADAFRPRGNTPLPEGVLRTPYLDGHGLPVAPPPPDDPMRNFGRVELP